MNDADFSDVTRAAKLLENYDRLWAFCGGWAIDLFLSRLTRSHKDVDFAILRRDQRVIQEYLSSRDWVLEKVVKGQLVPWQQGEWIDLPVHVIWCKNPKASPDFVELLFNEVDQDRFLYRKDLSITLPFEKMIISSLSGIPILAPEIVLLYKSRGPDDPSAAADFKNILPELSAERRAWLSAALRKSNPEHVWLKNLS